MSLADFIVVGKEEEIVDAPILDGFLCSGNNRTRGSEPVKILFRGYIFICLY